MTRLRYTAKDKAWTSYWRDCNPRFHLYDRVGPSSTTEDLLDEIDGDPTHIFWG
ncbi:DUF3024 domain-containing protein [Ornithinimicrobium cerasi]|uniref:DUF3024 domain-containing protein n=1 Tax=Ornithinimicrobium cerasi TaxID=2248773 RepID=UPI003CC833D8